MSLEKFSNEKLDMHLRSLVATEREILREILLHIVEIERRKLYLTMGYSSLFAYLTKHIGYADGSAQRRIDAARLSSEVPKVIEKLESGELNLAQVSLIQRSIREAQSHTKSKVHACVKEALIAQISNKSFSESEVFVAQILNIAPKDCVNEKHQKDESVRLEITFTKSQWDKLNKMRDILSNSLPDGSGWGQIFEYVCDRMIQQKDKSRVVKRKIKPDLEVNRCADSKLARQPISKSTQREIHNRDKCCQYFDKTAGKICGSTWRLNIDHIQPVWAGGGNRPENLRVLCFAHNQHVYQKQANISTSQLERR